MSSSPPVPQGRSFKVRPVVVVQSDRNNGRLSNTIVVMVTSNTRLASTEATQVLIDVTTTDGQKTGLALTSAVKCENLYTLPSKVMRKIGIMPQALMQQVDAALKVSLGLQ
jgi:mRNA-degrading endonuclease toxin of MazEF toxin-antitoxin module